MSTMTMNNSIVSAVLATAAAPAAVAMAHFAAKLTFETDCSDVFSALSAGADDCRFDAIHGLGNRRIFHACQLGFALFRCASVRGKGTGCGAVW